MSLVPMMGHVVRPNIKLAEKAPQYYMGMGHTAEEVARRFGISREDQDAFAVESHQKGGKSNSRKANLRMKSYLWMVTSRTVDQES